MMIEGMLGEMNKPTFHFKKIEITSITLTDVNLKVWTSVRNPYPIDIPRSDLNMKMVIEGMNFSTIKTDLGKIRSKSDESLPLDMNLKYADLKMLYDKWPSKELLKVQLDGILSIPIPSTYQIAGKKSFDFPFLEGRDIPAVLPSIDIRNFKIIKPDPKQVASSVNSAQAQTAAISYLDNLLGGKKTSLASAASAGLDAVDLNIDTEFDIALKNQAGSKLNFNDLNYDLSLGGEKFLSGVSKEIINAGKESLVKVKTSFPLKSVSSGIAESIQRKSSDFRLIGNSSLQVPGISESLKFNYDKSGNFKW
jgi:LEA14-like dessication related protein